MPAPPLPSSVALSKILNLSVLQLPHLKSKLISGTHLIRLLRIKYVKIAMKLLEQYLAHRSTMCLHFFLFFA